MGRSLSYQKYCILDNETAENSEKSVQHLHLFANLFKSITDVSPFGYFIINNTSDEVLFYNKVFCQIWNIENHDLPPDGIQKSRDIISICRRQVKGKDNFLTSASSLQQDDNSRIIDQDIELIDGKTIKCFSSPIQGVGENENARVLIFGDITVQKKNEEELRQQGEALSSAKQFLNQIINSIGDPLIVKDRNLKYILANDAFSSLVGYSKEELLGKNTYNFFSKKEADLYTERDNYVLASGEKSEYEEELTDANGMKHIVSAKKTLYRDENGESFIITTVRDETEKKVAEINTKKALDKEKELNDLKSKFISMVSHEYRTPLTSILSSVELMEMFGEKMSELEKDELLCTIKKSVDFLTALLNDVLIINRNESGRLEFNPMPVEIICFVKEVINNLAGGSRISLISDELVLFVSVDTKLFKYILSNLLSNALKYSPKNSRVELKIRFEDEKLHIEVFDRGIGISVEDQVRVFDPFFRARNAAGLPGSGLGLSIVKSCVELHRGELNFDSTPNEGTRFRVTLPAQVCK